MGGEEGEDVARKVILRGKGIIDVMGKVFVNAMGLASEENVFNVKARIFVRVIEK